jgi:hypothetical protein
MALVLADRVNETTTTAGTGTITLDGAVSNYQSFAVIGNGNQTYYTIFHQTLSEWEVGIGTYTSAGTLLSRDTVLSSSNSNNLVNFSAGTKNVFCDYPAGKAVYEDVENNVTVAGNVVAGNGIFVNATTVSANYTIASGYNGISVGPMTVASGVTVTVTSGQIWTIL